MDPLEWLRMRELNRGWTFVQAVKVRYINVLPEIPYLAMTTNGTAVGMGR